MRENILYLFLSFGFMILFLNCKDRSVTPPEATIPEISVVELSTEPIIVNDTVLITVNLSEELGEEHALKWQLTGYQTEIDTITSETIFSWKAPPVHGIYEHSVQVLSATGESVSEAYSFSTDISSVPVVPEEGNKLVFSMPEEDGSKQIFSMNIDGTDLTQLTFFENGSAYDPSWSPDGRQIMFAAAFGGWTGDPGIYFMNEDGTDMRPMKSWPDSIHAFGGENPRWSPDETKIVYSVYRGNTVLMIYDIEKDEFLQLTDPIADSQFADWSPDGERILFATKRDYYDADSMRYRSDLYTMDVNGENLQRLTETGFASHPNWQTGNKFIAYDWSRRGNRVFYLDISSNQIHELETPLEFEASPQWSESDEFLFVHGRMDENATSEVQIYDFSQDPPVMIERYQGIEPYWLGIDFNWYYYKE